jgi:hypothetical protein
LIIPEAVPEESGYRRSINIVQIFPESHQLKENLIYMRPLEDALFMGKRVRVAALTESEVIFQHADDRTNRTIALQALLEGKHSYQADN